ncbi:MAE_28990/MAE_18760 family HEPN-like nuclease [Streptococcus uberis]|uniref:MAE_28990/MAE_18760 family HEPN-like nuclease n=1 Tax=Streptococcus uberis TaxID=1349 RepID=UPI0027DAF378|nr:MAE_28990/MAE_18760 family HEPN-like nuclease [Streptococcus uberis]MCK1236180.1 MAE_28990/MAE_18760 family HEPN-like nuclease [Streptococcus uberis]
MGNVEENVKDYLEEVVNVSITSITNEKNFLNLLNSNSEVGNIIRRNEVFSDNGGLYKLILSVYATFEYTIKECCIRTLHFIDEQPIQNLTPELQMLIFRQKLNDLRKKISENRNDRSIIKPLTDLHIKIKKTGKFNSNENMIDTKSNLNYETLKEIIEIFNMTESEYNKYRIYIESLITYRNMIAHGNRKDLSEINIRENILGNYRIITLKKEENRISYEELCEALINLIKKFTDDLTLFINEKKFLAAY